MAGSNNFLVFDQNLNNIESDSSYSSDAARLNGVTAGMASALMHNKLYRQASIMAAALGQFISNANNNASDASLTNLITALTSSIANKNDLNTWALNQATADTGTANNYVISPSYSPSTYVIGMIVKFTAGHANTGPSVINVNGLGNVPLVKGTSTALVTGDILVGQTITGIYDGANIEIISINATMVNGHTASGTPNTVEQTNIIGMTNEINTNFNSHLADKATSAHLAHVMPDGTSITVDSNGIITAIPVGSQLYMYNNLGGTI